MGFPNYGDEYKVMGLAPYGEAKYLTKLEEILELTNDGFFRLNNKEEWISLDKQGKSFSHLINYLNDLLQ